MDRLTELEIFRDIAAEGSLAAVARKTGKPTSAITRILNGLEQRLGTRLIERTTRRMALTEAGQRLSGHLQRLLDDVNNAIADTTGEAQSASGLLRVTAPLVFGQRHMAPILTAFLDVQPDVRVELALIDRFVDLIDEGFDVALRIGDLQDSTLVVRRVGKVSSVFVASPGYIAKNGAPRAPEDLLQHQLILLAQTAAAHTWHFVSQGKPIAISVKSRYIVNRAELAIAAALEDRGIMTTFSYQVADHLKSGRLVRLLPSFERPPVPVQLVFPSNRFPSGRLTAFLEFATPRLRSIPQIRKLPSTSSAF